MRSVAILIVAAGCSDDVVVLRDAGVDLMQEDLPAACDPACEPGYVCDHGACTLSCQEGLIGCVGDGGAPVCTNLDTDRRHCGACDHACGEGFVCDRGSCAISCPSGLVSCDGLTCTNLDTDAQSCGACGNACAAGSLCIAGQCVLCADDSCRVAFVSAMKYTGALGGLDGADAKCAESARAAGLHGTYRAWLSSSSISAAERLAHPSVPYVRTDGVRVAANWAQLVSGTLAASIDHDELGRPVSALDTVAFTGTLGDGSGAASNCADWSDGTAGAAGLTGTLDDTDDEWTNFADAACNVPAALYCLEQ